MSRMKLLFYPNSFFSYKLQTEAIMIQNKLKIEYLGDETLHNIQSSSGCQTSHNLNFNMNSAMLGHRHKQQGKAKSLKNIIKKFKADRLKLNFLRKIRLNSIYRQPCDNEEQVNHNEYGNFNFLSQCRKIRDGIGNKEGISLGNYGLIAWSLTNLLLISVMVLIFSIAVAFPEVKQYHVFSFLKIFSMFGYLLDVFLNFAVRRYEKDKYLLKVRQIAAFYCRNEMAFDLVTIIVLPIQIFADINITLLVALVHILKMINNLNKIERFEYLFINSSIRENYFGMIKVFLTNFVIGHFLSVFLNLMAGLNEHENWLIKLNFQHAEWYIKYIWGYYWGTNIMLTVGFGDISATNHYEAIVLVFIETFSCVTLAYNINYVGALIGSMREKKEEKLKKLKIVHRMCKQNFISNEMESKVVNFIEESHHIKQSFEYETQDEVLKQLPKALQKEYRIEANQCLFDSLGFLTNLSKKSLLKLAERVTRKICHREEILLKKFSITNFIILQKGNLAFTCRTRSLLDGKQIEVFEVNSGAKPKILSLDFIKNKTINYNVKSNTYSILYYLTREDFMTSLKFSDMDFQLFCVIKDKQEYLLGENNLYECSFCPKQFHNKFDCSRLHYIPLKELVITRYLNQTNNATQTRKSFIDRNKISRPALFKHHNLKHEQRRFILENFDQEYFEEIENLERFYSEVQNKGKRAFGSGREKSIHELIPREVIKAIASIESKATAKISEIYEARSNMKIWDFQIDEACNYNFYFREGNPENLRKIKRTRRTESYYH